MPNRPGRQRRQDAEQRRLRRQLQRRHEQHRRHRRATLALSVAGAVVVVAVVVGFLVATGQQDHPDRARQAAGSATPTGSPAAGPTSGASTPATSSAPPPTSTSCTFTRSGQASRPVHLPPARASLLGTPRVRLRTSQGPLTLTLDRRTAPCAVDSFLSLVRQRFYDRTTCHRLVTKGIFIVQCGDPTGTGRGGPGYVFDDELTGHERYTRGVLALANAGPNRNGSQFLIVYRTSGLGPQYTIFGRVSSGLAAVDRVARAGTTDGSTDGRPRLPLTIRRAVVR